MSHFAEVDQSGLVKRVIVAEQSFIDSGAVGDPSNWIQTSYTGSIRKRFAGPGYYYNKELDAFIPPKHFDSFVLDKNTCTWEPPKPKPTAPLPYGYFYSWDESKQDFYINRNPMVNI